MDIAGDACTSSGADRAASAADADSYEGYIGRWSRVVAGEFLAWLKLPARLVWCDVGCGTGALTGAVLATCDPLRIAGFDPDRERVAYARLTMADPRAEFAVGEGTRIDAPAATYDVIVAGLAFPAIADTAAALAEFSRIAKPRATIAAYVWDFDGEMQLLRSFWDAANALDPGAEGDDDDDEDRYAICRPEGLDAAWRAGGLIDVEVRPIDAPARFTDFADFWQPFLRGTAPAQTYVASLDDEHRAALRARLQATLPTAPDGSIALVTRAWAVRGTVR